MQNKGIIKHYFTQCCTLRNGPTSLSIFLVDESSKCRIIERYNEFHSDDRIRFRIFHSVIGALPDSVFHPDATAARSNSC